MTQMDLHTQNKDLTTAAAEYFSTISPLWNSGSVFCFLFPPLQASAAVFDTAAHEKCPSTLRMKSSSSCSPSMALCVSPRMKDCSRWSCPPSTSTNRWWERDLSCSTWLVIEAESFKGFSPQSELIWVTLSILPELHCVSAVITHNPQIQREAQHCDGAVFRKLSKHLDEMFARDFPFYLLVAFRVHR